MTKPLTLISFDLCPYVQRAAIALAEKGVPFEKVDIDLANKPDWFLALSPLGKVPVLKVGEDVLFESAVIVEYLDETHAPALHPADPLTKARHRAWMEFGASMLGDIWILETTADRQAFDSKIALLKDKFARLEPVITGPFFAGDDFAVVDAVFAPVFRYCDIFETFAGLKLFDGLPKVEAWRQALKARPSVSGAVVPDYPERLRAFVTKQNGVLAGMMA